ncbi:MAG: hypothetical protein RL497_250 [Pseudomonadota bacterium]|jgi:alpha-N-acetylglucosamine transferase
MGPLTPAQINALHQCVEEECSVVELLQEVRCATADRTETRAQLLAEITRLAVDDEIEFFLDEFAATKIKPITQADALERLNLEATWDMHHAQQLHLRWRGE